MPAILEKIFEEAILLPADARMSLIEKLLSSLNLPTQPEIDRLWAEEAERRISQIDKGEVELISGEDVFAAIREKYRR
ncbi:MAG: addiction module protein [Candidatus Omnitrophota bacterium]